MKNYDPEHNQHSDWKGFMPALEEIMRSLGEAEHLDGDIALCRWYARYRLFIADELIEAAEHSTEPCPHVRMEVGTRARRRTVVVASCDRYDAAEGLVDIEDEAGARSTTNQVHVILSRAQDAPSTGGVDWVAPSEIETLWEALSPGFLQPCYLSLPADSGTVHFASENSDVAVGLVPVRTLAELPGIAERTLFSLNVRFLAASNRVSKSLRKALRDPATWPDFHAFHNGVTILCDTLEEQDGTTTARNLSIVNGAQSVIAFMEAAEADGITLEPKVLVKLVKCDPTSELARNIAVRSNTQVPVDSRNLRALDPAQTAIRQEIESQHPEYEYVTHPDGRTVGRSPHLVPNDEAAQAICAFYLGQPWLAVKKSVLFEDPHYSEIFAPWISASRIIAVWRIRNEVLEHQVEFPEEMRRSWRLLTVVLLYLVSERMKTSGDYSGLFDSWERDVEAVSEEAILDLQAGGAQEAIEFLSAHANHMRATDQLWDFRTSFKNQKDLVNLAVRYATAEARS